MRYLILSSLLLILTACWPTSVSFKDKGSMDERWKKFSVLTMENEAPNATLSYPALLTEDLKDGIQNNTRLKLESNKDSSQIVIEGTVVGYNVTPAAIQQGEVTAKSRLTVSVKFFILINVPPKEGDLTENDMNMTVSRFADFPADQDLSSVESNLLEEINKQIVQDVINKLMSNW